jgi:hypothetical protein
MSNVSHIYIYAKCILFLISNSKTSGSFKKENAKQNGISTAKRASPTKEGGAVQDGEIPLYIKTSREAVGCCAKHNQNN